jgi:hypothetical protein
MPYIIKHDAELDTPVGAYTSATASTSEAEPQRDAALLLSEVRVHLAEPKADPALWALDPFLIDDDRKVATESPAGENGEQK